jgi:CPA1 family monovalent cation:H+ antiporter
LGVSGVLAVVTAGLNLGWRLPELLTFKTRLRGGPVWEMVEFLLNGFVFILIGLQLPEVLRALSGHAISIPRLVWYALLISLTVILIRVAWVFPVTYLPRLLFKRLCRHDPPPRWSTSRSSRGRACAAWSRWLRPSRFPSRRATACPFPPAI